ncbi:MAG TPA: glycosyltransferase [Elusimicrobiota bacterium]|nr:glycosyltransferase [Elusimicrobiota bacterium]
MSALKKRVLFLYIAISSGHQRAAEALMGAVSRLNPHIVCHGIDTIAETYPIAGRFIGRMYLEMLKYTPQIWEFLYDNPAVEGTTRELREVMGAMNTRKIYRLLKRYRPRCLVCTQAVPLSVLANLKRRGRIKLPLVGVVTDFDAHSYWLSRHVDLYLVATDEIKRKMVREGIKEHRVAVTGIPIDPHFAVPGNKVDERDRLGLHPDKPTVLVTGGSRGLGPLEDIVSSLRRAMPSLQVIAVCGHNTHARDILQERFGNDRHVRVFGFTRNLPRFMDAADLLVSKPGGMTCAESMAKGLPLVMIRPIPGQEERNARYLLKHGAAARAQTIGELVSTVQNLLKNREHLRQIAGRAKALAKPDAAPEAAEAILKILREPLTSRPAPHDRARTHSSAAV